jgi:5-methylcytosine-specific restriction endonuclease McrA
MGFKARGRSPSEFLALIKARDDRIKELEDAMVTVAYSCSSCRGALLHAVNGDVIETITPEEQKHLESEFIEGRPLGKIAEDLGLRRKWVWEWCRRHFSEEDYADRKRKMIREGNRRMYAKDKERIKELRRERYAALTRGGPRHTRSDWEALVEAYNGECHYCLETPDIDLTKDHIVAVRRGGSDSIDNIVPACRSCNSSKGCYDVRAYPREARKRGFLYVCDSCGREGEARFNAQFRRYGTALERKRWHLPKGWESHWGIREGKFMVYCSKCYEEYRAKQRAKLSG